MTTKPATIFCCPVCDCTDVTASVAIKVNCTPDDRVGDVVTWNGPSDEIGQIFECPECEDNFWRVHEVVIATKECLTCPDISHHKIHKFIPEAER